MKRQHVKRLLVLILSVSCVAALTACSGQSAEKTAENQSDANESALANSENTNLYGFDEPVHLKVGLVFNSDFEWEGDETEDNNTWWDLYKENGYDLEIMYSVDGSQLDTKLSTAITSGNYPDIMAVSGVDLVKYAQTGVIADISNLYKTYASDELKEYQNWGEGTGLESAMVDGKLYGIPQVTDYRQDAMMMFIRQDWLDNLNLEMPTTMEELKSVAKAFTKDDPDGNGTDDTYGLVLNGKEGFSFWSGIQAVFEGYGAAPGYWNGQFTFVEKDGQVVWGGSLAEEMKAGLKDLQEMYKEGSLAKNFGTMDYNQVTQDVGAGKCGIYFAPRWGAMIPALDATKSDSKARIVSAKIPDGLGEDSSKPYIPMTPVKYYVISSKCETPEALIKMCNLSVDKFCHYKNQEEYDKYVWGKKGLYGGAKTSLIELSPPSAILESAMVEHNALKTGDKAGLKPSELTNVTYMEAYKASLEDGTLIENLKANNPDVVSGLSMWTVSGDDLGGGITMDSLVKENNYNFSAYNYVSTDTMSSKYSTLDKLTMETIVKIISGEDVESYDNFLNSWEALGGSEVTREAQEWFDQNK